MGATASANDIVDRYELKSTLPLMDYQQLDYVYLNALPGADDGYCIVTQDERGEILDLVTTEGAVSEGQLKKAVRYGSYREHTLGAPAAVIGTIFGSPLVLPISVTVSAIAVAVAAQAGFMGYFLKKGIEEEESSQATFISTISIFPENIIAEQHIRDGRAKHLIDEDKSLTFSSEERGWRWVRFLGFKKLDHIAGRLQEMTPEFPQGCDHLRETVN